MKIISFKANNIKNLRAVEISPDGHIVDIRGKNGAGKSAILDSIFTALTGKRLDDPIRKGSDRAEVVIELDGYIVRKRWTGKGEYLEVMNNDGDKKTSPQTFLDNVIGKLSFDPLSFKTMKPKDQLDLLKQIVGLDFSDIEADQKKVYDERTGVNARIKAAIAQLQTAQAPDPKTPDEEILFKDELEKLNQLREKKKACEKAYAEQLDIEEKIEDVKSSIDVKFAQITKLQDEIKALKDQGAELENKLAALVHPPEVTEDQITGAELALQDIETKNVAIRAAKRYRSLTREADKVKKEADALSQRIERLEQDKATRIGAAKMPIDGLSLGDNEVLYKGLPFSRLSTGEQIRVSTAIAMKLNPALKVILIHEGSEIDSDGMRLIADMAKENDYQIWVTKVDEEGKVGFFIEDGMITKVDGKTVDEEKAEETTEGVAQNG